MLLAARARSVERPVIISPGSRRHDGVHLPRARIGHRSRVTRLEGSVTAGGAGVTGPERVVTRPPGPMGPLSSEAHERAPRSWCPVSSMISLTSSFHSSTSGLHGLINAFLRLTKGATAPVNTLITLRRAFVSFTVELPSW